MKAYKALNQQVFSSGEYKLVPIRHEDRYKIMQWRNEQIEILRQQTVLTKKEQDTYFKEVVANLFELENPKQLLFSMLFRDELVAYGGLVHINWHSLNAEISFLIDSAKMNELSYIDYSSHYFPLITDVARNLGLKKIYTYGYDTADYRFYPLYRNGFELEAYLHEQVIINGLSHGVRIYSYFVE